jgi:hypothetical protein
MSNNTNLSKLANVLADASDGQYLKSTGSGGVVFDTVAAGTTTVADITALEALTAAQGDMAFVLSNNNVYIRKTAGWYKIATVTNNQLESVTVTMSGGGTAGDPYLLALDGTDTLATGAATDPEGLSVTWSAAPISPATLSGSNIVVSSVNVATITQGTGASSNVFTIDPVATTGTHNFSLRFSVTDGINATINADKDYTLNFVLTIADSKYTTMLAEAVGANNGTNSSLTDSSSNNKTITNTGTPVAGTFSPYRSGGYSTEFQGVSTQLVTQSFPSGVVIGSDNYTVEFWLWRPSTQSTNDWVIMSDQGSANLRVRIQNSGTLEIYMNGVNFMPSTTVGADAWHHICFTRGNSNAITVYLDGTSIHTQTGDSTALNSTNGWKLAGHNSAQNMTAGLKIRDLRVVKGSVIVPPSGGPTEPLEEVSGTYLTAHTKPYLSYKHQTSSSDATLVEKPFATVTGDVATKPFGPYDYSEYAAADYGGSIYFERVTYNSGSCITVADHNDFTLGTSDWTVKFWVFHDELNASSNNAYGYFSNYYYNTPGGFGLKWMNQHGNKPVLEYMNSGSYAKKIFDFVPSAKIWYYYELTCSSSTVTFKVNGETIGTQSVPDLGNPDRTLIVGSASNGSSGVENFLGGYIADFQYVIGGTASESSIPTAPMTTASNSKLHIKGTDASILDKSASTDLVLVGNTVSSTTQAKFANTKSMYFDGSGDFITTHNLPQIGNSDFTFETWMYETSHDNNATLFDLRGSGGNGYNLISRSGDIRWLDGGGLLLESGSSLSTNTWYHVVICRQGSNTKIFINGSQTGPTYTDTNNYVAGTDRPIFAGNGYNTSAGHYTGYLQDIRLSVGKARYTSNFSVPTAPLEG